MKKSTKTILVIAILIMWIILIIFDCYRLNNSYNKLKQKPLITIMNINYDDEYEYGTIHIGLGYSVKHFRSKEYGAYNTIVYVFYVFPLDTVLSQ